MTLVHAVTLAVVALVAIPTHAFLSGMDAKPRVQKQSANLAASKHPFIASGEALLSLEDDALQSPAQALIQAGNAWALDWEEVTFACSDAAEAFGKVTGYEKVAEDLQDLSLIGGCTSVGPPSSVPNLLDLQRHFKELAGETGNKEFEHVADAFGELAREFT